MPISRDAFQIRVPGDPEIAGEDFVDDLDRAADAGEESRKDDKKIDGSIEGSDEGFVSPIGTSESTEGNLHGDQKVISPSLPPADPTSAGKQDEFGAAYPERETHRSVATGRDVPQFTDSSKQRESREIHWDEALAQTKVYEGRARMQKNTATEHLARIHDIVELLLDLSETHSSDGERKLQSLESKVSELEMRYAINRSAP